MHARSERDPMVERIIDRVTQKQMPQQRPDGYFHPGVMDANMGNTDQVPVYSEDHSKGTWGMRGDHTRRKEDNLW